MFRRVFLLVIFLSFVFYNGFAQSLEYRQGEILVELNRTSNSDQLLRKLSANFNDNSAFKSRKIISEPINVYKISFDHNQFNQSKVLRFVKNLPETINSQYNHLIKYRKVPNDPRFDQQWQYINTGSDGGIENEDMDADLAWDLTTGGITAGGDTIVACIIDDGLDETHTDFGNNIWINHAEIPNNGIDDDGNGYIDDRRGWDSYNEDDDIYTGGGHGTPVTGIVGAQGDNELGVTGVNWNVKLMIVRGGGDEANALASYAYPYTMRKMYNESGGTEGAFVVVTNASWGTDFGQPEDAPLWCNFYDALGEEGIINCAATTNSDTNVDEFGDLPTACPSDYLIAVSNIERDGSVSPGSGFGTNSIDLGAYGENTFTVAAGNSYAPFGGTSAASPHVAGVVALAYALPCEDLVDFYRADPGGAALIVRQAILDGVKKKSELSNLFASGGSLNAANSLDNLLNTCSSCPFPLNVSADSIYLDSVVINWESPDEAIGFNLIYKATSAEEWDSLFNVNSPYVLSDLEFCTEYEIAVQSVCPDDSLGSFSFPINFETLGCCEPPSGLISNNAFDMVPEGSLLVSWPDNPDYEGYILEFKFQDEDDFQTIETADLNAVIDGLGFCQLIDLRLKAICITGDTTGYSEEIVGVTSCGICTTLEYCEVPRLTTVDEYIESITIGDIEFVSGDNGGYQDFSGFSHFEITEEEQVFKVVKGFNGQFFSDYVRAWVDIDRDGEFSESEMIFDEGGASTENVESTIQLPIDFEDGFTKMRVASLFIDPPNPCRDETFELFGEYEDHCVMLRHVRPCDIGIEIDTIFPQETEAVVVYSPIDTSIAYNVRFKKTSESDEDWNTITVLDTMALMSPLEACSEYVVQVRAVCDIDTSGFEMATDTFMTSGVGCMVNTNEYFTYEELQIKAFPNPFSEYFSLEFESNQGLNGRLEIFSPQGQLMYTQDKNIAQGLSQIDIIETRKWPAGIYYLKFYANGKTRSLKTIKLE